MTVSVTYLFQQSPRELKIFCLLKDPSVNVNYSDPQDVDPEETVEEDGHEKDLYRLKLGHDIYYCRPYQAFHTQLRYNFSGRSSSVNLDIWQVKNNNGPEGKMSSFVLLQK